MTLSAEQFAATNKANLKALQGFTAQAFSGFEKLVELNLQVAKTSLGEAADNARAVLSVKDAQELVALQATLLQPTAEKAASYNRHVYDILAAVQAEVTKVAEAQFAETQKVFASGVDSALKNAPAGSENAVALVKSAMAAANNAYESVSKAAKQAADAAEANFTVVTDTAMKASQAAGKAKRA